jgi:hypothetical protein
MEVEEGLVGPQNSSKAEKLAPVSMTRERVLPSMAYPWAPMKLWSSGLGVLGSVSLLLQLLVLEKQLGRRNIEGV